MQQSQEPHIIMGIDPGSCITGYGILSYTSRDVKALDFGCIRPPAKAAIAERYRILFEGIESLLDRYRPHAVSIETQFVYKNAQSALKLGMAKGMAMLAAARREIPIYEYAPKKAKLAVVGHGSASKEQVQKMIQLLLKLPNLPQPEDAADALALALCHSHSLTNRAFL